MFCIYCGHEILDHHSYCTSCGKLRIDIALKKFEEPSKEVGYFVQAETVEEATMRGSKEGLLETRRSYPYDALITVYYREFRG